MPVPRSAVTTRQQSPASKPIQGSFSDATGTEEFDSAFAEGLADLEGFSHSILVYHFHPSDGFDLTPERTWRTATSGYSPPGCPGDRTRLGFRSLA